METAEDSGRENVVADAEARYLLSEQIRLLCQNAPLGLLGTFVNATILAFLLRNAIPLINLISWLGAIYLIVGLRYFHLQRCHLPAMTASEIDHWRRWLVSLTALSGLLWGMTGIFLFPAESIAHQAFIAFVLGGMAAGALAIYGADRLMFLVFTLPALGPYVGRLFSMGGEIHIAMGAMALLFTLIIVIMGKHLHATTIASLKLRHENMNYVEYLSSAKGRAEQLNSELAAEIEERKRGEAELRRHREHLQELVNERTAALSSANELLKEDIAERRKMEEQLRQSQEFITRIINSVDDGIIVVDHDYRIISANQAYCEQVNHPLDQVIGAHCYTLSHNLSIPCRQQEHGCPIARTFATGLSDRALHIHRDPEGKDMNVAIKSFPLKDSAGRTIAAIETISDVTEKLKAEEQMRNAQKLESVGILAGGIAHDFNNLLSGMFGYIDLAREQAQKDSRSDIAQHLARALGVFERAKHLTQQLLTFSKGGTPFLQTQPLVEHVQKAIRFALSGSRVAPVFRIADNVRLCSYDQNQLAQVFDNIVINACQAMPLGGKLEVIISNVSTEDVPPVLPPRDYVCISIRDYGTGIIPEHLPHIFDPFFTTKKEGSGLGLATSYSIVKKHGGHIEALSALGEGTAFNVYLPAAAEYAPAVETTTSVSHRGQGRILLLDDEQFMLDILSRWLQEMGYEAVMAKEGDEAVSLTRKAGQSGKPFLAAVLDLTIPGGRGGKDIIGELLDVAPSLKIVASSGYSEDPVMSNPTAYGFLDRLVKPYRKEDLTRILESLWA